MSFLMERVADPVVSGTLLGKLTRARELGVTLDIDPQCSLSTAVTSTGQEVMMTVIGNLLDNACHAVGENGQVQLFFTVLREKLLIEVEDNGPGVPTGYVDQIYAEGYSNKSGKHR